MIVLCELIKFLRSHKHCIDIIASKSDTFNAFKVTQKYFEELGLRLFEMKTTRRSFALFDLIKLCCVHNLVSISKYKFIMFFFPKA